MTEPSNASATGEPAVDLVLEATAARVRGDEERVGAAIHALSRLDESQFYGGLASFAHIATLATPKGWMPMLFVGNPPRPMNIDREPAAAFAIRFVLATLNGEEELRLGLWRGFLERTTSADMCDEEAAREVGIALGLLVDLAAEGTRRVQTKSAHKHHHPAARHGGRRAGRRPR